jgi:preprotein translocase subunit SecA
MEREEIVAKIEESAAAKIQATDLSPLDTYLVTQHGQQELAKWIIAKFEIPFDPLELVEIEPEDAVELVMDRALAAYRDRERIYPVDFVIDMTSMRLQQDPAKAIEAFCQWVKLKYELDWTPQSLPSNNPEDLKKFLLEEAMRWDDDRIERRAQRMIDDSDGDLDSWLRSNWKFALTDDEKEQSEIDSLSVAIKKIQQMQRAELAQLERNVLLQIFDGAWKEHLHQMDQVRESIGFRSFSQLDPRIEFKREGARLFDEMFGHIQDRVTDLVFKAKMQVRGPESTNSPGEGQKRTLPDGGKPAQQKQQRPPQKPKVAEQSVRAASAAASKDDPASGGAMTVGRNEPCPCGSGKKYKKCCGGR